MATVTWGLLDKSQIDSEKIEEAIVRLILEHNEDETAHLGAGQSLQSHKAAEIIDHLVASIIADKIAEFAVDLSKLSGNKRTIISNFESLDGWGTSGTVWVDFACLNVRTSVVLNNIAVAYCSPSFWSPLDFTKKFLYQSTVRIPTASNQEAIWGLGSSVYISGGGTGNRMVGFRTVGTTLYAFHSQESGGSDVFTDYEIVGIDVAGWHIYRVEYDPTANTIKYYIDEVLVKTVENFDVSDVQGDFAIYQVKTTTTAYRYIVSSDILFSIEK